MDLLYFITFLSFLQAYDSRLISTVVRIFLKPKEVQPTRDKIANMTIELSKISMTDEWAKYAKLQRKITAEKALLEKSQRDVQSSSIKIKGALTLGTKFTTGLMLMFVAFWFRKNVVTSISPDLIYPVSSYVCWSEDVPGGITTPAWIILSSTAARAISSFL